MSVSNTAATLYNFTVNEQTYQATFDSVRDAEEVDLLQLHSEFILLTVVIVDIVLRSEKIHQIHGPKADKVFSEYLNCFKEQTTVDGADQAFIDLLNDRGNVYKAIIENRDPASELLFFELTQAFAKYCGATSGAFHLAVLKEFGSLMETIGKFLETVHLK